MVFKFVCFVFFRYLNILLLWKHLLIMQNLTETWCRELLPGFSKPVMNVKTLLVSCWWGWTYIHCYVQLTEICQYKYLRSGFQKPDSQYTSSLLKKTRQCSYSNVSKPEQHSGTAFGKICSINKCFHRSCLNINFWIYQELLNKKMLKP